MPLFQDLEEKGSKQIHPAQSSKKKINDQYSFDIIKKLFLSLPNLTRCLRYIFSESKGMDIRKNFQNELTALIELSNQLNQPVLFLFTAPGSLDHWMIGIKQRNKLWFIQPLGLLKNSDFYTILSNLIQTNIIENIYLSEHPLVEKLQNDPTYSGLICVELLRCWCQYSSLDKLLTKFSISETKTFENIKYQSINLETDLPITLQNTFESQHESAQVLFENLKTNHLTLLEKRYDSAREKNSLLTQEDYWFSIQDTPEQILIPQLQYCIINHIDLEETNEFKKLQAQAESKPSMVVYQELALYDGMDEPLYNFHLVSQRAANQVSLSEGPGILDKRQIVECQNVAACADGDCGFTAIQNYLLIKNENELAEKITREAFIGLIIRLYNSKDSDYSNYVKEILNDLTLEEWSEKFSRKTYWMQDEHFKLLSIAYNIEFRFFIISPEEHETWLIPEIGNKTINECKKANPVNVNLVHLNSEKNEQLNHFDTLLVQPTDEEKRKGLEISEGEIKKEENLKRMLFEQDLDLRKIDRHLSRIALPKTPVPAQPTSEQSFNMSEQNDPMWPLYEILNHTILNLQDPTDANQPLIRGEDVVSNAAFKLKNILELESSLISSIIDKDQWQNSVNSLMPIFAMVEEQYLIEYLLDNPVDLEKSLANLFNAKTRISEMKESLLLLNSSQNTEIEIIARQMFNLLNLIEEQYQYCIKELSKPDPKPFIKNTFSKCSLFIGTLSASFLISQEAAWYLLTQSSDESFQVKKSNLTGLGSVRCLKSSGHETVFSKRGGIVAPAPNMHTYAMISQATLAIPPENLKDVVKNPALMPVAPVTLANVTHLRAHQFKKEDSEEYNRHKEIIQKNPTTDILIKYPELAKRTKFTKRRTFFQLSYGIRGLLVKDYLEMDIAIQKLKNCFGSEECFFKEIAELLYGDASFEEIEIDTLFEKLKVLLYDRFEGRYVKHRQYLEFQNNGDKLSFIKDVDAIGSRSLAIWLYNKMIQYPGLIFEFSPMLLSKKETFLSPESGFIYALILVNSLFNLDKIPVVLSEKEGIDPGRLVSAQIRAFEEIHFEEESIVHTALGNLLNPLPKDLKFDNAILSPTPESNFVQKEFQYKGQSYYYLLGKAKSFDLIIIDADELDSLEIVKNNEKHELGIKNFFIVTDVLREKFLPENVLDYLTNTSAIELMLNRILALQALWNREQLTSTFLGKIKADEIVTGFNFRENELKETFNQIVSLKNFLCEKKSNQKKITLAEIIDYMIGPIMHSYFETLRKGLAFNPTPLDLFNHSMKNSVAIDLETVFAGTLEQKNDWLKIKKNISLREALATFNQRDIDRDVQFRELDFRQEVARFIYELVADHTLPKNPIQIFAKFNQLKLDPTLSFKIQEINNLLVLAFKEASPDAVEFLINKGADINGVYRESEKDPGKPLIHKLFDIIKRCLNKQLPEREAKLKNLLNIVKLLCRKTKMDINQLYQEDFPNIDRTKKYPPIFVFSKAIADIYTYEEDKDQGLIFSKSQECVEHEKLRSIIYEIFQILVEEGGLDLSITSKEYTYSQKEFISEQTAIDKQLNVFYGKKYKSCLSLLLDFSGCFNYEALLERIEKISEERKQSKLDTLKALLPNNILGPLLTQSTGLASEILLPPITQQIYTLQKEEGVSALLIKSTGTLILVAGGTELSNNQFFIQHFMGYLFAQHIIHGDPRLTRLAKMQFQTPSTEDAQERLCLILQIGQINCAEFAKQINGNQIPYESAFGQEGIQSMITQYLEEEAHAISLVKLLADLNSTDEEIRKKANVVYRNISKYELAKLAVTSFLIKQEILPKDVFLIPSKEAKKNYIPVIVNPTSCFIKKIRAGKLKDEKIELKLLNILFLICLDKNISLSKNILQQPDLNLSVHVSTHEMVSWFKSAYSCNENYGDVDLLENSTFIIKLLNLLEDVKYWLYENEESQIDSEEKCTFSELMKFEEFLYVAYQKALEKNNYNINLAFLYLLDRQYQALDLVQEIREVYISKEQHDRDPQSSSSSEEEAEKPANMYEKIESSLKNLKKEVENRNQVLTIRTHFEKGKIEPFKKAKSSLQGKILKELFKFDWKNIGKSDTITLVDFLKKQYREKSISLVNSRYLTVDTLKDILKTTKIKTLLAETNLDSSTPLVINLIDLSEHAPALKKIVIKKHSIYQPEPKSIGKSFHIKKPKEKRVNLQSLTIIECEVKSIHLPQFTELSYLEINGCQAVSNFTSVDEKASKMKNLTTVKLVDNPALNIDTLLNMLPLSQMKSLIISSVLMTKHQGLLALFRTLPLHRYSISNLNNNCRIDLNYTDVTDTELAYFQADYFSQPVSTVSFNGCINITLSGLFNFLAMHTNVSDVYLQKSHASIDIKKYLQTISNVKDVLIQAEDNTIKLTIITTTAGLRAGDFLGFVYTFQSDTTYTQWTLKEQGKSFIYFENIDQHSMHFATSTNISVLYKGRENSNCLMIYLNNEQSQRLQIKTLKLLSNKSTASFKFNKEDQSYSIYWKNENNEFLFNDETMSEIKETLKLIKDIFFEYLSVSTFTAADQYFGVRFKNDEDFDCFMAFINGINDIQSASSYLKKFSSYGSLFSSGSSPVSGSAASTPVLPRSALYSSSEEESVSGKFSEKSILK